MSSEEKTERCCIVVDGGSSSSPLLSSNPTIRPLPDPDLEKPASNAVTEILSVKNDQDVFDG
jgi:hypothetical protein